MTIRTQTCQECGDKFPVLLAARHNCANSRYFVQSAAFAGKKLLCPKCEMPFGSQERLTEHRTSYPGRCESLANANAQEKLGWTRCLSTNDERVGWALRWARLHKPSCVKYEQGVYFVRAWLVDAYTLADRLGRTGQLSEVLRTSRGEKPSRAAQETLRQWEQDAWFLALGGEA